jgi:hypothetical protein
MRRSDPLSWLDTPTAIAELGALGIQYVSSCFLLARST